MVEKTSRQKLARYRFKHRVLHEPRGQAPDRCWEGKLGAAELPGVPRWVRTISLGALCPRTSQLAVPWNRNPVVQEGLHPHCDAGKHSPWLLADFFLSFYQLHLEKKDHDLNLQLLLLAPHPLQNLSKAISVLTHRLVCLDSVPLTQPSRCSLSALF